MIPNEKKQRMKAIFSGERGVLLGIGLTLCCAFYEILESFFLEESRLHLFKVGAIVLLLSILIAWDLFKYHIPKLQQEFLDMEGSYVSSEMVVQASNWLIGLRWIAFILAVALLIFGNYIFELVPNPQVQIFLNLCVLSIAMANLFFVKFSHIWSPRRNIQFQMICDITILTGILHFSGGLESPLYLLYLFHIVLSAMLLSPRDTYKITALICFFFLLVGLLEFTHLVPHTKVKIFSDQAHSSFQLSYVLTLSGLFVFVAFLIAYFTSFLAEKLRIKMQKVKDRTDQLLQASKLAAVGELIGYIAHEINNPIGIITLKTENLLSEFGESLPSMVSRDLKKIATHTQRISGLVKKLLTFTRQSIGQEASFSLASVVEETLELARPRIKIEDFQIQILLDSNLPLIKGNPLEIQQILLNLINNAMDAMVHKGKIIIRGYVKKELSVQDGPSQQKIFLEIQDTGEGILAPNKEKIFQPFFSTKGKKGLGLGLAITKMLVESQGGTIEFKSIPGEGTTFFLSFPLFKPL